MTRSYLAFLAGFLCTSSVLSSDLHFETQDYVKRLTSEVDYTPYVDAIESLYHANRGSNARWAAVPADVERCYPTVRYNKFRIAAVASVSAEGALFVTLDAWQKRGLINRNRCFLDLELTSEGGDTFTYQQLFFDETDIVEFVSAPQPQTVVHPGRHRALIKLVLDELEDSEGNPLSFPTGSDYSLSLTLTDFRNTGAVLTKDCVLLNNVALEGIEA